MVSVCRTSKPGAHGCILKCLTLQVCFLKDFRFYVQRYSGQYGEVTYSDAVAARIEEIIDSIKNTAATEIAVVNYAEKAA
jgi:hypothetical protein